jgi:hypothetical protein
MKNRKNLKSNNHDGHGLGCVLRLTMIGTLILQARAVQAAWECRVTAVFTGGGLLILEKASPQVRFGRIMGSFQAYCGDVRIGKGGIVVFFKYFAPGLVLDLISLLFLYRLESMIICGLTGAIVSVSKLLADMALGLLFRLPMGFLKAGLIYASVLHFVFGFAGGIIAWILIKRLKPRIKSAG